MLLEVREGEATVWRREVTLRGSDCMERRLEAAQEQQAIAHIRAAEVALYDGTRVRLPAEPLQ